MPHKSNYVKMLCKFIKTSQRPPVVESPLIASEGDGEAILQRGDFFLSRIRMWGEQKIPKRTSPSKIYKMIL